MRESWRLRESQWWRRKRPSVGAVSPAAVVVLAALGCLAGCAPTPTPSPTPTAAFASEEEAYAAAEKVYRAYNDALNEVDPVDPATFEPLFVLTSGAFEAADRKFFSAMHADGHLISGDAVVLSVAGDSASTDYGQIALHVCLDVSAVKIVDANGASLVASTRPDVYALSVELVVQDDNRFTINASHRMEDETCGT